jgi:mono/diheme cytochrome c family protein
MRKFFKITGYIVGAVVIVALSALTYFNMTYPRVEKAPDISIKLTPARVERGSYLVNSVVGCFDCHSKRDWDKFSGPIKQGTEGMGGEKLDEKSAGVPGTLYAPNITPAALGNWTDGQIVRALTCGVDNKGRALYPIMPYAQINSMSKEDIYSIVAYLRTIKPIQNNVPRGSLNFPMNLIVKTMPIYSFDPPPPPDTNNMVSYGKYLVNAADCAGCHTPMSNGNYVKGMMLAGGVPFQMSGGIARSANITPDSATGIGKWDVERFVSFFKAFASDSSADIRVSPSDYNTPMPMTSFAGMTDHDLSAMYDYLRTINHVHNEVVNWAPGK